MPYKVIINEDYRIGYVPVCDVCGEVIRDWKTANVLYLTPARDGGPEHPGETFEAKIACKLHCTDELDRRVGKKHYWMGLNEAQVYLENGSETDMKAARRSAASRGSLHLDI